MKNLNLKNFDLTPLSDTECLMANGGCSGGWWCVERMSFEIGKAAGEVWDGIKEGFEKGATAGAQV